MGLAQPDGLSSANDRGTKVGLAWPIQPDVYIAQTASLNFYASGNHGQRDDSASHRHPAPEPDDAAGVGSSPAATNALGVSRTAVWLSVRDGLRNWLRKAA